MSNGSVNSRLRSSEVSYWPDRPILLGESVRMYAEVMEGRDPDKNVPKLFENRIYSKKLSSSTELYKEAAGALVERINAIRAVQVRSPYSNIESAIEDSKFIASLNEDGWDGGSAVAVPSEIYARAVDFLKRYGEYAYEKCGFILMKPSINPTEDGSIDIFWENDHSSLLISIENSEHQVAYYYGKTNENGLIGDANGEIPTNGSMGFLTEGWLSKFATHGR